MNLVYQYFIAVLIFHCIFNHLGYSRVYVYISIFNSCPHLNFLHIKVSIFDYQHKHLHCRQLRPNLAEGRLLASTPGSGESGKCIFTHPQLWNKHRASVGFWAVWQIKSGRKTARQAISCGCWTPNGEEEEGLSWKEARGGWENILLKRVGTVSQEHVGSVEENVGHKSKLFRALNPQASVPEQERRFTPRLLRSCAHLLCWNANGL